MPKTSQLPTDLINAIPSPPKYDPLLYREISRSAAVGSPLHASIDPYSLFKLFLPDKHFETIAANTNDYAKAKGASCKGKRVWV